MGLTSLTVEPATDLLALEQLQEDVWGPNTKEIVRADLLQAHLHHGACLLQARLEQTLIGMVYAFPGPKGSDYLYSHLAAILPQHQGQGFGQQLKLAQASWARENGYRRIIWTFDPFRSSNAILNVQKLGAVSQRYFINYYGALNDNLNQGRPTDRLEVDWWLQPIRKQATNESITFYLEEQDHTDTRKEFLAAFARGLSVISFDILNNQGVYGLGWVEPA